MADIRVPTLGESVTEATVATWFKKVGDTVKVDEMLCELETDKVTVEVPVDGGRRPRRDRRQGGRDRGRRRAARHHRREGRRGAAPSRAAKAAAKAGREARRQAAARPPRTDAESAPANEQSIEVMVPTLGESVTEATVSTWFKKLGDAVTQDEMLCELETDKVSVEVPAPASGTLAEIYAEAGATVNAGGKLGRIGGGAAGAAAAAPVAAAGAAAAASRACPGRERDVENAPSANKLMADRGLAPGQVEGTGRDGRIMKEDVLRAEAPSPCRPRRPLRARARLRFRARRSRPRTPRARSG